MATGRFTKQQLNQASGGPPEKHVPAAASNYVAVARGQDLVVIRVVGRGNMLNAPALQEFVDEQRTAGFTHFLFDFERCIGLDSTFMGVMVGMNHSAESNATLDAVPMPGSDAESHELVPMSPQEALDALAHAGIGESQPAAPVLRPTTVSVVNVTKEVLGLLSMLGVDKFVKVRGSCDLSKLETTILPEKSLSPTERHELIYKAHELLVEIDKRNEAQFGDLLKALSKELGK